MRAILASSAARKYRLLRLKRAEWAWQDRERGYSTYRNGRPYVESSKRDVQRKQLIETIMAVLALALVVLCAGIAGGVTGL